MPPVIQSINDLLAIERKLRPVNSETELYQWMKSICLKHRFFSDLEVTVVPIYSRQKLSQVISLEGKTFVVLDEGLVSTFQILNAIALHSGSAERLLLHWVNIWVAEAFSNLDCPQDALWCIHEERARAPLECVALDNSTNLQQARYCRIQETFVLFHELGHVLLSKDASFRLDAQRTYSIMLKAVTEHNMIEDADERNLSQIIDLAGRMGIDVKELMDLRESTRSAFSSLDTENDMLEELMTDGIALVATVETLCSDFDYLVEEVHLAVALCLRNLLFFETINFEIRRAIGSSERVLQDARSQLFRITRRYDLIYHLIILGADREKSVDLTMDRMAKLVRRHYEVCMLPLKETIHEHRVFREFVFDRSMPRNQIDNLRNLVDGVTGWH